MYVQSWMSTPALALPAVTRALDALEFLRVKGIRRVPVLDANDDLAGIVTLSDLQALFGPAADTARRTSTLLGDIMTRPVVTLSPTETLERASQLMLENEVSGLPVVDGREVVGMITESDIFRAFNQIMGIGEQGPRLVINVPSSGDLLDGIRRRLGTLAIRSLAAIYQPEQEMWEVIVRVRGRVPIRI